MHCNIWPFSNIYSIYLTTVPRRMSMYWCKHVYTFCMYYFTNYCIHSACTTSRTTVYILHVLVHELLYTFCITTSRTTVYILHALLHELLCTFCMYCFTNYCIHSACTTSRITIYILHVLLHKLLYVYTTVRIYHGMYSFSSQYQRFI